MYTCSSIVCSVFPLDIEILNSNQNCGLCHVPKEAVWDSFRDPMGCSHIMIMTGSQVNISSH